MHVSVLDEVRISASSRVAPPLELEPLSLSGITLADPAPRYARRWESVTPFGINE